MPLVSEVPCRGREKKKKRLLGPRTRWRKYTVARERFAHLATWMRLFLTDTSDSLSESEPPTLATRELDFLDFAFAGLFFFSCFFGESASLLLLMGTLLQRVVSSSEALLRLPVVGFSSSLEDPLNLVRRFSLTTVATTGDTLFGRSLSEALDAPWDLSSLPSSLVAMVAFDIGCFFFMGLPTPLVLLRGFPFLRVSSEVR